MKGRPSKYTPELADEICQRLSEGEPLRQICREEYMPHWSNVYEWMRKDEALAARIAHARELGHDAISEECLEIADDATNDYMDKVRKDGEVVRELDAEHVQRSKLRIETRLKLLAKWSPKKYGDRQEIDHTIKTEKGYITLPDGSRIEV